VHPDLHGVAHRPVGEFDLTPLPGELDRVGEEVDQDLLELLTVGVHREARALLQRGTAVRQARRFGERRNDLLHALQHVGQLRVGQRAADPGLEKLGIAGDRVEWRPQLVAHGGEEAHLGQVRLFRLCLRLLRGFRGLGRGLQKP
jgi:hypothetical protein